jgi:hypothetical protein
VYFVVPLSRLDQHATTSYLTNSMEQSSWESDSLPSQEIPCCMWDVKVQFSTTACHQSLSWDRCIKFTPSNPISVRSILRLWDLRFSRCEGVNIGLLGCDVLWSCRQMPTFQRNFRPNIVV